MFHENGPVQSAAKALRLLGLLMEVHQPLTLAALSKQTGWPKSTIHGLLSAMRESAVVDQQSDGRYCLGVRLFEYGCAVGAIPRGTARRVGGRDASAAALHLAGQGVSIRDGRPRGEARPAAPHIGALYAQDPRHVGGTLPCDAGRA